MVRIGPVEFGAGQATDVGEVRLGELMKSIGMPKQLVKFLGFLQVLVPRPIATDQVPSVIE